MDQAFGEGGSGDILAGLLVWALRLEDGRIGAVQEMRWIVGVEESFAGGVGVGSEARVAILGSFLPL